MSVGDSLSLSLSLSLSSSCRDEKIADCSSVLKWGEVGVRHFRSTLKASAVSFKTSPISSEGGVVGVVTVVTEEVTDADRNHIHIQGPPLVRLLLFQTSTDG